MMFGDICAVAGVFAIIIVLAIGVTHTSALNRHQLEIEVLQDKVKKLEKTIDRMNQKQYSINNWPTTGQQI